MVKIQSPVMEMIPADSTSPRSRRPVSIRHVARTSALPGRPGCRRRPAWHGEQGKRDWYRSLRPGCHVVDGPLVDVAHQQGVHGLDDPGQFSLGEVDGRLAYAGVLVPGLRPVLAPLLPVEEGLDG